jgi:hypothetical protein
VLYHGDNQLEIDFKNNVFIIIQLLSTSAWAYTREQSSVK